MQIRKKAPGFTERGLSGVIAALLWPLYKIADSIIWKKVRNKIGFGRVKSMISGGSSIPLEIDKFFNMAGLNLIVGYGLTETSPVLCNRLTESNILGTVGRPAPGTTMKIIDITSRKEAPIGEVGLVLAKGPGIMKGYMDNDEATQAVISNDGYFDTGDLGRINPSTGDFIITGRAKDTIVLSNGENVEPQMIEEALVSDSAFIDQAMLAGQDSSYLSAIVVLNIPALAAAGYIDQDRAIELEGIIGSNPTAGPVGDEEVLRRAAVELGADERLRELLNKEVRRASSVFKPWERVMSVHMVLEPMSVANNQLTPTLKLKRHIITKDYQKAIDSLYSQRR